jgi:hypothetical protein
MIGNATVSARSIDINGAEGAELFRGQGMRELKARGRGQQGELGERENREAGHAMAWPGTRTHMAPRRGAPPQPARDGDGSLHAPAPARSVYLHSF